MRRLAAAGCVGLAMLEAAAWSSAQELVRLKIQGSTTVNPVVTEAAEQFHRERGWEILVDTQGGSSGGISALGEGLVDLAMSSKPLTDEDRATYPGVKFVTHPIGRDGVALVVSAPVWNAGARAVSKAQVQALYEGRIKNWRQLGGPDAPVVFYNKEPGRGTWEVFADWAYDGHAHAPSVDHPEVGGNEEGRNKVASHPSAITQLSFTWAEGSEQIKILGLTLPSGEVVLPSTQTIASGAYPMTRTLLLITNGQPTSPARALIEFLLSEQGQALVKKHGYLPIH